MRRADYIIDVPQRRRVGGDDVNVDPEPVRVERRIVESFVGSGRFRKLAASSTVIVDPPRTGLSKDVLDALVTHANRASRRVALGRSGDFEWPRCAAGTFQQQFRGTLDRTLLLLWVVEQLTLKLNFTIRYK